MGRPARAALAFALALACSPDGAYDRALGALAARLEARPANRELAARVAAALPPFERDAGAANAALRAEIERAGLVLVRVPGLFHASYPETGADLAAVDRWLGGGTGFVATPELATVEEGAAEVARALREDLPPGRRAVLLSASKGSADVRAALEGEPGLGQRAAAWIDLVGVLEGTPLSDARMPSRASVLALLPEATADSLSREVRLARAAPDRFPRATRAYHVAAFPRVADVGRRARDAFAALRLLGPNDGYVLLDAYTRAPGPVLVVRGADHYLRLEGVLPRLSALLRVALEDARRGGPPAP
jgi:hypothetical protein